jgi:hypothetical protein
MLTAEDNNFMKVLKNAPASRHGIFMQSGQHRGSQTQAGLVVRS